MYTIVCIGCGTTKTTRKKDQKYCTLRCARDHQKYGSHGDSYSRLNQTWCHMKTRCLCETAKAYPYYGGRGITVCQEWIDSYESFRAWALSNGYDDTLEIDRKDTNGNYCPENCRWANRTQQMRNTRKRSDAKTSKFKGVSLHSQNKRWIAQIGIHKRTVYIGSFDSELDAAQAYDQQAILHFGEFASVNFPKQGGVSR